MKKGVQWLFLILCMLIPGMLVQGEGNSPEYIEGQAIVCVEKPQGRAAMPALLAQGETLMNVSTKEEGISIYSNNTSNSQTLMLITDAKKTTEELIEELNTYPEVVFAEPNYKIEARDMSQYLDMTSYQWGYHNTGQQDGVPDIDMNISGWNQNGTEGEGDVVIAVVDTGIDYTHPDLSEQMWHKSENPAWAGLPGGEYGYNACSVPGAGMPAYQDTEVMDDQSHGTHCAGIIGASWNQHGTSGAANKAKLLGVKILNNESRGTVSDAIRGYGYLKQICIAGVNLKAINNSWGDVVKSEALNLAVEEVGKLGAVTVFASGNDSMDLNRGEDIVKSMYGNPYAVIVNAIQPTGRNTIFTNYSDRYTHLAAPGATILSTIPVSKSMYLAELVEDPILYNNFEIGDNSWSLTDSSGKNLAVTEKKAFEGDHSSYIFFNGKSRELYSSPVTLNITDTSNVYTSLHICTKSWDAVIGKLWAKCKDGLWKPLSSNQYDGYSQDEVWGTISGKLPEDTDFDHFQIKLQISYLGNTTVGNDVYFDCFGVGTECVPYSYLSGTSMAAPAVTGEVALLAQKYEEPADKLAARVIGGVERTEELNGTSISGGYASFDKTQSPYPVLQQAEWHESYLDLKGYFFGTQQGTITIEGQPLKIISWGEESIRATVQSDLANSQKKVEITTQEGNTGYAYFQFEAALPDTSVPELSYCTHVQNIGWQGLVNDGERAGTVGQSLRMEAIQIQLNNRTVLGDITYRTHVQNIGWMDWKNGGEKAGTMGQSLRMEAVQIQLTGELAQYYDITYRVHVQNIGWTDWVKNGETGGTVGQSLRAEAIQIQMVPKKIK